MNGRSLRSCLLVLLTLSLIFAVAGPPRPVLGQQGTLPVVGVWSNACGSSNITLTNPSCGNLGVGTTISVELNVTNAPSFNAFDLRLYYDHNFLDATSTSVNQTVLPNAITVREEFFLGNVRLAIINLGDPIGVANGTIVHIFFKILAVGVSPLTLAAGMKNPSTFAQSYTQLTLGQDPIDVDTADGYFKNDPSRLGPMALFTFSPTTPESGQLVEFNATASFDPDSTAGVGIRRYEWDFGDGGAANETSAIVTHRFASITGTSFTGNFSVRLRVVDVDGFSGMKAQRVFVAEKPLHDVELLGVGASPSSVKAGDNVTVTVVVRNQGTFDEAFDLVVEYGPPTILLRQETGVPITSLTQQAFTYILDTTGLAPASYEVVARATIPTDNVPGNNSKSIIFSVVEQSESPFLLLAAGAVAAAGAIVGAGLLLKRRRRRESDTG